MEGPIRVINFLITLQILWVKIAFNKYGHLLAYKQTLFGNREAQASFAPDLRQWKAGSRARLLNVFFPNFDEADILSRCWKHFCQKSKDNRTINKSLRVPMRQTRGSIGFCTRLIGLPLKIYFFQFENWFFPKGDRLTTGLSVWLVAFSWSQVRCNKVITKGQGVRARSIEGRSCSNCVSFMW